MKKLLVLLVFLSSCASYVPYVNVSRKFVPYGNSGVVDSSMRAKRLDVYAKGEQPTFTYEKMGTVEAKLNTNFGKDHLFDHVKYEAWQYGADAIIELESKPSKIDSTRKTRKLKNKSKLEGIAVKYVNANDPNKEFENTVFKEVVLEDDANVPVAKAANEVIKFENKIITYSIIFAAFAIFIAYSASKNTR